MAMRVAGRLAGLYSDTLRYMRMGDRLEAARGELATKNMEGLKRRWARTLLRRFGIEVSYDGDPPAGDDPPSILVGNHMSYIDILLLMATSPVVFVAKDELSRWPVVGAACKRVGTVFVRRGDAASRSQVRQTIADRVCEAQQHVVLFPSGTTRLEENRPWHRGAFFLAQNYRIPLRPFRIWYQPARTVAYIDRDVFPVHMWQLLSKSGVRAHVEYHDPVEVEDSRAAAAHWQTWASDAAFRRQLDRRWSVDGQADRHAPLVGRVAAESANVANGELA